MTPQRRIQVWTICGVIIAALGVLISAVECAGHHADAADAALAKQLSMKLDVTRYEKDLVSDSAWKADVKDMVLDALCAKNVDPSNRRCRK